MFCPRRTVRNDERHWDPASPSKLLQDKDDIENKTIGPRELHLILRNTMQVSIIVFSSFFKALWLYNKNYMYVYMLTTR